MDISFACVIRALGGLDSIAQAGGRCNRHGEKQNKGQVFVLNLKEPSFEKVLPDIYQGQLCGERVLREFDDQDILQPNAMNQYFNYYFYNRSDEMRYDIKDKNQTLGNLLDWLSDNSQNIYTPKNNKRTKPFPLLMQSFKSAGQFFNVIDAPTRAVIVPYNKGKEIIAQLCGAWNPKQMYQALSDAQQYSVNVFPNVFKKLMDNRAIYEVQAGLGIYYLDDKYHDDNYGLSLDETGEMTFYNL